MTLTDILSGIGTNITQYRLGTIQPPNLHFNTFSPGNFLWDVTPYAVLTGGIIGLGQGISYGYSTQEPADIGATLNRAGESVYYGVLGGLGTGVALGALYGVLASVMTLGPIGVLTSPLYMLGGAVYGGFTGAVAGTGAGIAHGLARTVGEYVGRATRTVANATRRLFRRPAVQPA